jgi:Recombinase
VTLVDQRVYSKANGFSGLIFSIATMSRAHEESETKSRRVSAAWAKKRNNAGTRKLTAQCPAWLKLFNDKTSFVTDQKRADVIVSIFEDSANGMGNYSITRRLNRQGIPTFGRSDGWQTSYVSKILANRAVLGEFQPNRMITGDRISDGDAIKHYFPQIVDEALFYRAQSARGQRRTYADRGPWELSDFLHVTDWPLVEGQMHRHFAANNIRHIAGTRELFSVPPHEARVRLRIADSVLRIGHERTGQIVELQHGRARWFSTLISHLPMHRSHRPPNARGAFTIRILNFLCPSTTGG